MKELKEFLERNYGGSCGYGTDEYGNTVSEKGHYNFGTRNFYDKLGLVLKEIYEKLKETD